jgi:hypothetical protein
MFNKKYIVLFMLLFLCVSCSAGKVSASDDLPEITIPVEKMNIAFVIKEDPPGYNSHENGKRFELVARNLSDKTIIFAEDYGLKIFVFQNQTWNLVNNKFLYTGGEKILPTAKAFPPGLVVLAYPYIPDLTEPTKIRIVVMGHDENSNTDIVGAYIDITLLP